MGLKLVNSFYKKVGIMCSSLVHLEMGSRFFTTFAVQSWVIKTYCCANDYSGGKIFHCSKSIHNYYCLSF